MAPIILIMRWNAIEAISFSEPHSTDIKISMIASYLHVTRSHKRLPIGVF
jgi:hypothetical protein